MEFDTADSSIMKTYIYGNSQIIAGHDGDHTAAKYFYLHDRLGSVRYRLEKMAEPILRIVAPSSTAIS